MVSPSQSPSRDLAATIAGRSAMSDPMRDNAAARSVSPAPVVFLATPPQEAPEIVARALVRPDHLIDPFGTQREAAFVPQPKAELLRTPPFRPQLPGDGPTDTARQFARLVPDQLLAGLCRTLRLLKAVAPPSCVASQFPADRPLAKPQGLADLSLGLTRLAQGVHLTAIFVRNQTIHPHS